MQVTYLPTLPETTKREFGIYRQTPDSYQKYVILLDEWDMSRDGINHCSLQDFPPMEKWK
ncbi:MAG: hypothetical protein K2L18_03365 [Acetatifactor sp.]|nr:hypothetical protein [Acetatifactor sp.]